MLRLERRVSRKRRECRVRGEGLRKREKKGRKVK